MMIKHQTEKTTDENCMHSTSKDILIGNEQVPENYTDNLSIKIFECIQRVFSRIYIKFYPQR